MTPEPMHLITPVLTLVAGVMAFAAVHHLLIGVRRPSERAHITFAAMCAVAAVYTVVGIPRYLTSDPDALLSALRWSQSLGMTIGVLLAWFVSQYLSVRAPRFLWTLTVVQGSLLLLNLVLPLTLMYTARPQPAFTTLPWGERLTYPVAPLGIGVWPIQIVGIADFGFAYWAAWKASRRGDWRQALPVAVAVTLLAAGVFGLFGALPSRQIAYLGLILVMSLAVSNRVLEAGTVKEALAESEQRLRTLVETAPEAVLLLDAETGVALEANGSALTLFRAERRNLVGVHPATLAPPEQDDGQPSPLVFDWRLREALRGGRPVFRWVARDSAGSDAPCEARLVRLPGTDPCLVRLSLVDLRVLEAVESRRWELEAQLRRTQRLEAIGRLAGGVAHDFNNYVTAVVGNLEMVLEDHALEGEDLQLVEEALHAAGRTQELTSRLLAFSRNPGPAPRVVDMQSVMDRLAPMLARTLGEDVRVSADVSGDLWPFRADTSQLESALVNLAINARDAMPGGGTVTLRAENSVGPFEDVVGSRACPTGPHVAISVEDTGHGMEPETVRRAADPFFTTKEVGKGTGLGLNMVFSFTDESGGALSIRSAVGGGTTVTMLFPREDA